MEFSIPGLTAAVPVKKGPIFNGLWTLYGLATKQSLQACETEQCNMPGRMNQGYKGSKTTLFHSSLWALTMWLVLHTELGMQG